MLLGREREQAVLDGLVDAAREGHSGVLAVVGEVGTGKSALLDDLAERAAGVRVLRARGIQSEARIPFASLFELVRPALPFLEQLAVPQREAVEGALALRPSRAGDRFAVGAGTLALLASCADDRPLLVLVDDAHWIDGSSADALRFAIRRLVEDRIAVVLGLREGESSLLDGTDLAVHRLAGLDRAAAAELVAAHAPAGTLVTDDVVERLHRATGGNPLALIELAHDLAAMPPGGPLDAPVPVATSVGRVYADRVAELPLGTRDLLLLTAASDTGDLATIARAAGLAGLDLGHLAAAESAGLVAVVERRVEFRHPLVRSAVYAGAPPARRRAMHRALAGALPDVEVDRRAWHLALAALGQDEAATSALQQAGHRARERSAYEVASQAYERAGTLAPGDARRSTLLLAAADSAWLAGSADRAVGLLDQARRHAPTRELVVPIDHLRGHIATRLGPVGVGRRILLAAADRAAGVDADRAVVMLAEAVNAAFYAGDAGAMQEAAAGISPLLGPDSGQRARFFGTLAQGMAVIFRGEGTSEGASAVRRAVAVVEGSDDLSDDPRLLAWAAMGPLWLRESGADRALIDRALDVARRKAAVGVLPFLLTHIAIDRMASDRWSEAEVAFNEAIELARESGQRTDLATALARLAWLEARQGSDDASRAHADEARTLARELDLGLTEIWSSAALADLELGLGRLDAAAEQLRTVRRALTDRGVGDVDLSPEPELIELELRAGRIEEARSMLPAFERAAGAKGQPWALARAARCRGLLDPDDELDRHFGEALARHAETPDAFETARTRLAYGGRLRRSRRRVDAREQLRAALSAFEDLGARPWADMARAELAATGETARRRDPSTRDQLTPQELQIALLLTSGRTTREAAASLFLSPKTVEYHLRHVYRKLGVNSRDALATVLSDRRS